MLQLLREGLIFERLLLGQTAQKHFIIRNTSLLPVKWHMAGLENLAPEFKVIPSSGELPARQEARIAVELTAQQKKDLSDRLTLQVSPCLYTAALVLQVFGMALFPCLAHGLPCCGDDAAIVC